MKRKKLRMICNMEVSEVRKLAAGGETHTVEFKRRITQPERVIRELVAFANTDGGQLLVGVNDDGVLSGLKHPEDDEYLLRKAINRRIRPYLRYKMEKVKLTEKKWILVFRVKKSHKRPHFIVRRRKKECYLRIEDRTVRASNEMIQIMERQKSEEGVHLKYGDTEQKLMEYLDKYSELTVGKFAQLARIQEKEASRTMVNMVLARVISVQPREGEDVYLNNPLI
jgi:predicted HTH transcriptional regulator